MSEPGFAIESLADIRAMLGRARYRKLMREAFALFDAKAAVIDEHGSELTPEARESAFTEISYPAVKKLLTKAVAAAIVAQHGAAECAEGKLVRIEKPAGGTLFVPLDSVTEDNREMIRAARIRRKRSAHAAGPEASSDLHAKGTAALRVVTKRRPLK